mmetsp:Transcript_9296/g.29912  ORF Transcript_9296/g.29912 Transcript_9296/m.29912 type:complete len:291 (+) Transcript_9296:390-1262(+)
MMMPTHEWRSSSPAEWAGLIGDAERRDQRCSIGDGAGMSEASMRASKSVMYCKSRPSEAPTAPHGSATSDTHCCPPHSKPRIRSDQSTRAPCERFQKAASARFTSATCDLSSGASSSNASRSCAKFIPDAPAFCSGARCSSSSRSGSVAHASSTGGGGAPPPSPSPSGSQVTTTTVSVCGIHMYRMCWCWSSSACLAAIPARVSTLTRCTSLCAGTHCRVTSETTPSAPSPTLARRKRRGLSASERQISPSAGVISRMLTTCSSTGGIAAPVPCAPTWTKPPICCSAMEA